MATIPQAKPKQTNDQAAVEIAQLIEEHMEEQGWSEEERNRRVALASARVAAAVAQHAKHS